jgi:hypothetical protein
LPIVTDDNDGHGGGEEEKINRVNNPHATKIDRNLTGFGITLVSHQIRDHFGDLRRRSLPYFVHAFRE